MRLRPVAAAALAVSCLGQLDCQPAPTGEVTFRLLRVETAGSALREDHIGLNRELVDTAVCQVLDAAGREVAGGQAAVEPDVEPGDQIVRLLAIPAADGYFARIAGLDEDAGGAVVECGISGPFDLQAGEKATVTIYIVVPPASDPDCLGLCSRSADCPADHYCPSPCARGLTGQECTNALCARQLVGESCLVSADCGSLTCLQEDTGYPGGYCSQACADDATCPDGTACRDETPRICVRRCASDADCRDDYRCAAVSGALMGCVP